MQEDVAVAMELASLYSFELRGRKSSSSSLNSPGPRPQASPIAPAPPASDDLLDFMSSATPPPPPPPGPGAMGAKTETSLGLDIEFDHAAKRVRVHIDQGTSCQAVNPVRCTVNINMSTRELYLTLCRCADTTALHAAAALERLPKTLQPRSASDPVVIPIIAILFAQVQATSHVLFLCVSSGLSDPIGHKLVWSCVLTFHFLVWCLCDWQGIDAKQTIANLSNQLKPGASTNVGGNSTLQPVINRRSLRVLNDYVHRCVALLLLSSTSLPPSDYSLLGLTPNNLIRIAYSPRCSCVALPFARCYPTPNPGPKAAFDRMANRLETVRATAYGSSEDFARSIDEISIHPMLEPLKEVRKPSFKGKHVIMMFRLCQTHE